MGIRATCTKSRWNETPIRGTANAMALDRNGVTNAEMEVVVSTSLLETESFNHIAMACMACPHINSSFLFSL